MTNFNSTPKFDDSWLRKIAMGQVPNWGYVRKFGSGDVGTTLTTIWSGSTEQAGLYVYPDDGGQQMAIYSTDANDTELGSGARYVQVQGLGPDLETFQDEVIALNGTSLVTLTKEYSRVNRAVVVDTGDPLRNTGNLGDIHISNLADTVLYAHINDDTLSTSQTQMALWTLPIGYIGYYASTALSTFNSKATSVYIYTRARDGFIEGLSAPFQSKAEIKSYNMAFEQPLFIWEQVPGGTDIEMRGRTELASDTAAGQFYVVYVKVPESQRV